MSGASARVATRWWSENRFLTLDGDAQRILFLLWTAPETALCGLTLLSSALIAERLRLKPGTVRSCLGQLEDREFIKLDPDAPLCWIKGYVETQLGGVPASSKPWLTNTATAVAGLPQTTMVKEFKAAYRLPDDVPKRGKKAEAPRGPHRDPDRGPHRDPDGGHARGAPIRSLRIGVGVVPAADPTAETAIEPDLTAIEGGRRA